MADAVKAYPICLDVTFLPCLVVGGGRVAFRKVQGLLAAGATDVVVVAPHIRDEIKALAKSGKILVKDREFIDEDLNGAALVFAATSSRPVNAAVVDGAGKRGAWVNAADSPSESSFHVPAVLSRGDLTIAAATSGASPALAAWIRDLIDESLPEGIDLLAAVSRRVREALLGQGRFLSPSEFRILFDSGIVDDLAESDWDSAEEKIRTTVGVELSVKEIVNKISAETL